MKKFGTQELETERLLLRKIRDNDYMEAFKNWTSSSEVVKYLMWEKHENEEVTKKLFDKWICDYDEGTYRWIVELKKTHELIGIIDVGENFIRFGTCEIGYCYGEKYWGNGYATEALKVVIRYLFEECEAETIFAECFSNNPASGKVMQNSGMIFEGWLKSRLVDKDGIRNDLGSYSITRERYRRLK